MNTEPAVRATTNAGHPCPDDVAGALAVIRSRSDAIPGVALILGSGSGALVEAVAGPHVFTGAELPGYPASSVAGHPGRIVLGTVEDRSVAFVQGRVHAYEGHLQGRITFAVRLLHALGCRSLIVTNAAGGINPVFRPGTLMFITDHIDFAFNGPLIGADSEVSPRQPGLFQPYDVAWTGRAERLALEHGIPTQRGIYLWTSGPSYETKAEIRAFARLGADAVGMSTVPEVVQARRLGIRVLGLSIITNPAAGLGSAPLSHDDVLAAAQAARTNLERLIRCILREHTS